MPIAENALLRWNVGQQAGLTVSSPDDGKQQTIRFQFDDVMSSCEDNGKVNDEFELWLNKTHGALTKVKATCGKIHDYLRMLFDLSKPGEHPRRAFSAMGITKKSFVQWRSHRNVFSNGGQNQI